MITNDIKENILKLSPKLQLELYRFIELLVNQNKDEIKHTNRFTFNWEGGLEDLNDINSVDLQHKALEWR